VHVLDTDNNGIFLLGQFTTTAYDHSQLYSSEHEQHKM